ncbi:MAG: nucleotidyltransferase substrate binding protein [Bacteroidetes bacterium]|nr:nucleotidyltransferase substrate binding protein [Bacteroidota bacterium]MCC6656278.1 nucleotidyltransferase substrate binding protein [Flavobacteriales bacterium]HMU13645.1 nucleotidyltransferase substrate binding protein [Flavobacteriales bacterium]HNE81351.1 nucleotidyltransferase substrate binding protein [Flavobacteriales bacterium]HNI05449.1 nucleotidyltransferase substrate binding protein [Flavobacteriales bacterium]
MPPAKLDLSPLRRSLAALRKVTRMDLEDEVVRDAAIKRFEFTYELAWKMMKRHLEWGGESGLTTMPRRELFRLAARYSLIEDPQRWFEYHEGRNLTSHTYDEANARKVVALLKGFVKDTAYLLNTLKEHHA